MTDIISRLVFPFCILAALAIWARGYAMVGDGFSAGALAGLGAALQYVALDHRRAHRRTGAGQARPMLVGGLLLALAVVMLPALWGAAPVTHYPQPGQEVLKLGVLEVHTAALFDLGVGLAVYGALVMVFDRLFPPLRGDEP